MEGRMTKYRQVSPERAKVWTERSGKHVQNRKVPVVYYLCRNRQLEQPHFIEVRLSSAEGLYLRDVVEKLNSLRGRGMASMYSWSCKRSYKNGFVWHDLCEDDLIIPAHGNEYVLKGSEIIEESNSGHHNPAATFKIQNVKQLPEPPSSRSQDDTPCSSSMNGKDRKHNQEDEMTGVSLDSRVGNSPAWVGSLSLTEYKALEYEGSADASTQTEESNRRPKKETCTRGVSTDDSLYSECTEDCHSHAQHVRQDPQMCRNSLSPLSSSSASSSGGKTDTLGSLIRSDVSKINSFRILEEEDVRIPPNAKLKGSKMLIQLISCGSISVKDHNFGLVSTYRPQFSHLKFPSPLYSTSVMLGELNCLPENPRLMGPRLEDKEYFSGRLVETKMLKEGDGYISLKRSSSFNSDRFTKQLALNADEETTSARLRCLRLSVKASGTKQPRSEPVRLPISDKPRSSSGCSDEPYNLASDAPQVSKGPDSFREEKENIIKIEESLLQELGL